MNNLWGKATEIKSVLNLGSSLVGVKLIWQNEPMPLEAKVLSGHRYCQALMKARHGLKAIPNSRGKNAYSMLKKKDAEKISATDPFKN